MFTITIDDKDFDKVFVALTLGAAGIAHIPSPNTPPPRIALQASEVLEDLRKHLASQMDKIREEFDQR